MMTVTKKRKCSVCKRAGHTKKTCPRLQTKEQRTKKPVRIAVTQQKVVSVHTVHLAKQKEINALPSVSAYKETPRDAHTERSMVNFAALVRAYRHDHPIHTSPVVTAPKEISVSTHVAVREFFEKKEKTVRKKKEFHIGQHIDGIRRRLQRTVRFPKVSTALAMLGVVCLLPFPALTYYHKVEEDSRMVVAKSTDAFLALQSSTIAALNANIPQAQYDLGLALSSFTEAKGIIDRDHKALFFVAKLLPVLGNHVSSRTHLLEAGQKIAVGNTYLVKGVGEVEALQDANPTERLKTLRIHIASALPQYQSALRELSSVDERVVPVEYQESFKEFKILYAAFVDDLSDTVNLIDTLNDLLGEDALRNYLVIGQNNQELRPTGGFMGSFAIVNVQKGKVTRLEMPKGGTYDVQGQLGTYLTPPLPLQVVNKRWEFQDANWFPDFPESARKIQSFYSNAWGESVDGVVAINASLLEQVLAAMGPVITESGVSLDQANALLSLRGEIEGAKAVGSTEPKAVLGDALDAIIAGLSQADTGTLLRLLTVLSDALQERTIQVYINDPTIEKDLREFGWSGHVVETAVGQDYLMVIATNIGGGKSDARIKQSITHQASVDPETGDVIDTVVVERAHTGSEEELFFGAANLSYVRIYVPKGATLIEAGGFNFPPDDAFQVPEDWYSQDEDVLRVEKQVGIDPKTGTRITEEFNKTVFGNWMAVAPGESTKAYVVYRLPMRIIADAQTDTVVDSLLGSFSGDVSRYSLFVQKQSGIDALYQFSLIYGGSSWKPLWRSRDDVDLALNGAQFETTLRRDEIIGVAFEQSR